MKTIQYSILITVMVILPSWVTAQTTKLPVESETLIKRLKEYELKELQRAKYLIDRKRAEVLVILKKHLRVRTKNGDLDKALAIRKEIKKLELLLGAELPTSLLVSNEKYYHGEKGVRSSRVKDVFVLDGDQDKGRMLVEFKHDNLRRMIEMNDSIELHIGVSHNEFSDTGGAISVSCNGKIVGSKKGAKRGEVIVIPLDIWKVVGVRDSLSILLECSSNDGVTLICKGNKNSAVLVFSKKE